VLLPREQFVLASLVKFATREHSESRRNRMVQPTWRRPDKDYGGFVCPAWNSADACGLQRSDTRAHDGRRCIIKSFNAGVIL
jgi:hypothetical protein